MIQMQMGAKQVFERQFIGNDVIAQFLLFFFAEAAAVNQYSLKRFIMQQVGIYREIVEFKRFYDYHRGIYTTFLELK
jgi:hypothetical protein